MATPLDDTDRRILDELAGDGRMSMRTLAERLHISRANAYARVDRLQRSGVIRGFRADVDPVASGLATTAYVTLNLRQADWRRIREQLQALPGIAHIGLVGGHRHPDGPGTRGSRRRCAGRRSRPGCRRRRARRRRREACRTVAKCSWESVTIPPGGKPADRLMRVALASARAPRRPAACGW